LSVRRLQGVLHTHRSPDAPDGRSPAPGTVRGRGDGDTGRTSHTVVASRAAAALAITESRLQSLITSTAVQALRVAGTCWADACSLHPRSWRRPGSSPGDPSRVRFPEFHDRYGSSGRTRWSRLRG